MKRIDKFLADLNLGSRSQIKEAIKKGRVQVNHTVIKSPDIKVAETDSVMFDNKEVTVQNYFYFMLHKPAGVISATTDEKEKTVLDLIKKPCPKGLFPVGRLDKDTEGLLLITNDGELGHHLSSPRHHIPKTYLVESEIPLSEEAVFQLTEGVDIGEKNLTKPAKIEEIGECLYHLTITEGKYHQIKRMLQAVDNKVIYLKRIAMGNLTLDPQLEKGKYRELTIDEIQYLKDS